MDVACPIVEWILLLRNLGDDLNATFIDGLDHELTRLVSVLRHVRGILSVLFHLPCKDLTNMIKVYHVINLSTGFRRVWDQISTGLDLIFDGSCCTLDAVSR